MTSLNEWIDKHKHLSSYHTDMAKDLALALNKELSQLQEQIDELKELVEVHGEWIIKAEAQASQLKSSPKKEEPGICDTDPTIPDSELDQKLWEIWGNARDTTQGVAQIKTAFKEAGYIGPEQVKKTQELVNQMAQNAQELMKLPVTVREVGTMTGAEWLERFEAELDKLSITKGLWADSGVMEAARKASGVEE